jgi:peptidyl-prolyl cis-trans isomerase D
VEPSRLKPLEEALVAVRLRAATEQARTQALELARGIREKLKTALEAGTSFEEACQQQALTPASPAPFARGDAIEGLGSFPALHEAVFATEAGRLTDVVDLSSRAALAFVRERVPPSEEGFAAEREALAAQVRQEQEQSRLSAWLAEVRSRAHLESFVENLS